ncbi:DNA metabolism protein [Clostridium acetobutylicum]|nr:DNA metabolism protein [Clostridium acetobutylicum]
MPNRSNLIYYYDGSFEGLMCCIFESYEKNEIPVNILVTNNAQMTLFMTKEVETDLAKASRVIKSIPLKMGVDAFDFIKRVFLTCLEDKELNLLLFMRLGYTYGPKVMNMLSNDIVHVLFKAVTHLNKESHLFKGFIRFSAFKDGLVAQIEPKNFVLPLLSSHFCSRYPEEHFLIHDKTHDMALIYKPYKAGIIPVEDMRLPDVTEEEKHFRKLWSLYYRTVEIEGRHNPKCRRTNMPKRYWKYLTEFNCIQNLD